MNAASRTVKQTNKVVIRVRFVKNKLLKNYANFQIVPRASSKPGDSRFTELQEELCGNHFQWLEWSCLNLICEFAN